DVSARCLEGKTVRLDEIPATDLDGIDPERLSRGIDQTLQAEVGGIGPGAAEDTLLALVGQHALHGVLEAPHAVRPGDLGTRIAMGRMAELEIGTVIVHDSDANALEDAVLGDR